MRQDTELLKSIADQAAEILTLRECVVTLKREVAALRAERDALRGVVAAADAMRFMPGLPSWAKDQYDAARAALSFMRCTPSRFR
jgi:hypothetical protein